MLAPSIAQRAIDKQNSYSNNSSEAITVLSLLSILLQHAAQESRADAGKSIRRNSLGMIALASQSLHISHNSFASLQKHNALLVTVVKEFCARSLLV